MRRISNKQKTQIVYGIVLGFAVIGVLSTFFFIATRTRDYVVRMQKPKVVKEQPTIDEQLLSPNEYSRPVLPLEEINGIVVHYTANPGTTAQQNRDYFEGLSQSHLTKASSNYIIGLDGEIIRCVPDDEIAYASNERNHDTLSIECCHFDETGEFYMQTYQSLVKLVAYLMGEYDIPLDGVIRHYDVTGKICPKYYVDHPEEWAAFLNDVEDYIEENGVRE
ncbi:MAG: N-acetylmuramoyl-L-alanine amidase [Lachnospiraceae bacterium]|nr:N-acetylmuramoyl-L-alanine amidase [Lachnospiraceae bacterium]